MNVVPLVVRDRAVGRGRGRTRPSPRDSSRRHPGTRRARGPHGRGRHGHGRRGRHARRADVRRDRAPRDRAPGTCPLLVERHCRARPCIERMVACGKPATVSVLDAVWALRSAPRSDTPPPFALSVERPDRSRLQIAAGGPSNVRRLSLHVIRHPRADARAPSCRGGRGLHRAHTRPGRSHPPRARTSRRPRRRPDRHRQDGGLRAADPPAPPREPPDAAPSHPRERQRRPALVRRPPPDRERPADPLPRPHADARAGHPGRGVRPELRPLAAGPLDDDLRRRGLRRPVQGHARRPRDRRRDARPAARHPGAGQDRPPVGRDPRPRRGGPDARHGLHPGHPQDHRPAARRSDRT